VRRCQKTFVNSYSYAIATGSSYIMALLYRQRCLAAGQLQQGQQRQQLWRQRSLQGDDSGSDGLCSYKVDYPSSRSPVVASTAGAGATSALGLGAHRQAGAMDGGGVGAGQAGLGRDVSYRSAVQRPAGLSSHAVAAGLYTVARQGSGSGSRCIWGSR
jgi:hypothetical protein